VEPDPHAPRCHAGDRAGGDDPVHRVLVSLVLGVLVPKRLALQRAAPACRWPWRRLLDGFASLMRPVTWFLSVSMNAVVRVLGGDPVATSEQPGGADAAPAGSASAAW